VGANSYTYRRDAQPPVRHRRAGLRRFQAAAVGISAAGVSLVIGATTGFAHHVVSTTPLPASGTAGVTTLTDTAKVFADDTRDVVFMLWAPGDCGKDGAKAEFTDTQEVTTAQLAESTLTSKGHIPLHAGTYNWTAEIVVDQSGAIENGPTECGAEPVNVSKDRPDIHTTPSDGGPIGTSIFDAATVTKEDGTHPTGTVTFTLFPPGKDCDKANAVYTSDAEELKDGVAHSGSYKTAAVGVYHWVAVYSGNADNESVNSGCDEEPVTTTKAGPAIATTASAGGVTGTSISDTATVSGGHNPTGTVTFKLFGPSDATCSGTPMFTAKDVALTAGSAQSGAFNGTSTAGTYNWMAWYSGDANNAAVNSKCTAEPVTITAKPTGGVGALTTPSTGADLSLKLAVGLLVIGVGLVTALTTEVIARRLHKRND
jgi:hypothetical protein